MYNDSAIEGRRQEVEGERKGRQEVEGERKGRQEVKGEREAVMDG
jgi:hypothetical protein